MFLASFTYIPDALSAASDLMMCDVKQKTRCVFKEEWEGSSYSNSTINKWIGEGDWSVSAPIRHIGVWYRDGEVYLEGEFKNNVLIRSFKTRYSSSSFILPKDLLLTRFGNQSLNARKQIQSNLAIAGYYDANIDGIFGPATSIAMRTYNKDYLGNANLQIQTNVNALIDELAKTNFFNQKSDCKNASAKDCHPSSENIAEVLPSKKIGIVETATHETAETTIAKVRLQYDSQDYSNALSGASTLAKKGNSTAQFILGKMYFEGQGTLQIYKKAHMWLNIASMNGSEDAKAFIIEVQKLMTPELINEAQSMALSCVAAKFLNCDGEDDTKPNLTRQNSISDLSVSTINTTELRRYFRGLSSTKRSQIQYALKKLGFYKTRVDGVWGANTESALLEYMSSGVKIGDVFEI